MQSWFQRFPDAGQQAWSWANLCWDTGPLAISWHREKNTSFANNLPTLTGDRSGCIHLEDLRSNNHHTPQEGFSWPCVWLQCHWWFLSPQLWCCLARCTSSWRSSPWCWMMLNGLAMFSVSHVLLSLDWDILGPAGRHMKAEIFNGRRSLRCFTCCDCPISELRKSKGPRVHSYCYDLCGFLPSWRSWSFNPWQTWRPRWMSSKVTELWCWLQIFHLSPNLCWVPLHSPLLPCRRVRYENAQEYIII
jgi:hypothetical protein